MDINGTPLEDASIAHVQAALLTGKVSARQVVEACLERIERLDQSGPTLNAVVNTNDGALDTADRLDRALAEQGGPIGPLHGIPVVVKDCLDTKDMPTSYGSEIFAEHRPSEDATVIAKLRDAGAVIVAKTTLPDWATSWFSYSSLSGETKNPYDLARDPGGSSSGTGAAVAAGYTTSGWGRTAEARYACPPRSATSSGSGRLPASSAGRDATPLSRCRTRSGR